MSNPMKSIMEENMRKQMDFQKENMKLQVRFVSSISLYGNSDLMW